MASFGSNFITISKTWTTFKTILASKPMSLQYDETTDLYEIFALDEALVYLAYIYKGAVPDGVVAGYSQVTNDADKSDFETNYKPYANKPIQIGSFNDPRTIHRFGNLTATSASEVLLSARAYNEQASQAQRSVKSSSVQDKSGGSGAVAVRLTYLDSNYVLKTEDLNLNGTTAVATVATDIRFVESFKVIQGASAVGAIELWTANNGTGTAICGIGAGTEDAFLAHHYVPAGMRAYVLGWSLTCSDDTNTKLKGQVRYGSNLVDVNLDLDNVAGGTGPLTAGGRGSFYRKFDGGMYLGEKTYLRMTVVPQQATSTIIRGYFDFWEDKA